MAQKPRYRTYTIKLWLSTVVCAPLVFLILSYLVNLILKNDPEEYELAIHLCIAINIILPTVLFSIVLSLVLPHVSKKIKLLKRVAIITATAGVIAAFLFVYEPAFYSSAQLYWGIFMACLYAGALLYFGLKYKI